MDDLIYTQDLFRLRSSNIERTKLGKVDEDPADDCGAVGCGGVDLAWTRHYQVETCHHQLCPHHVHFSIVGVSKHHLQVYYCQVYESYRFEPN